MRCGWCVGVVERIRKSELRVWAAEGWGLRCVWMSNVRLCGGVERVVFFGVLKRLEM